eukprot:4375773-Prymnesium_polylepis.2
MHACGELSRGFTWRFTDAWYEERALQHFLMFEQLHGSEESHLRYSEDLTYGIPLVSHMDSPLSKYFKCKRIVAR